MTTILRNYPIEFNDFLNKFIKPNGKGILNGLFFMDILDEPIYFFNIIALADEIILSVMEVCKDKLGFRQDKVLLKFQQRFFFNLINQALF